ncbi:MAG TPA: RNase adapter RapZ [Actinomycetaceae bacterium]|nr:RNase adapter RapZ [Actinomycetaceae bacterium]
MKDIPDSGPPTVPDGVPVRDEITKPVPAERPELLVITGMSGAGKTRAASALEDLSWYVVDNLPPRLLVTFASMMRSGDAAPRLAAVIDVRSREYFREMDSVIAHIRGLGMPYRIFFLDARDEVLVRRYESNRRPHPLQQGGRLLDGIKRERALLKPLRDRADVVIDTTETSVHDLSRRIRDLVSEPADNQLRLTVMSFGFKHGLPSDADNVVDVRFLSNPYWVNELRHLTGLDRDVSDYVLDLPGARDFIEGYVSAMEPVLDGYVQELKPYVTIAVGCTGGRHRSVAIAEEMARLLQSSGHLVRVVHRDVGRE